MKFRVKAVQTFVFEVDGDNYEGRLPDTAAGVKEYFEDDEDDLLDYIQDTSPETIEIISVEKI